MGLASGIGRAGSIVGPAVTGGLVTAGLGYPWGFSFFCAGALLAVIAMVAVPRGMETWAEGESATTTSSADLLQERPA